MRVRQFHRNRGVQLEAERDVRTGVVHVVALDAFVHDTEAATNNRLAASTQIIGEPEPRTKVCPVIVHEALRYAVLSGNADAIQVERNASQNRVRAGAQTGADGRATRIGCARADRSGCVKRRRVGSVVERWIEVAHPVVRFVRVRYAVPTQTEVHGQLAVYAPVVLNICGPRNVVPQTLILYGEFLILLCVAEQEVCEVVAGERSVKVEAALGLAEQVLHLLVERPAKAELQLVSALGPGQVIADLI